MPVQIQATGEATGFLPTRGNQGKPITVIGTAAIRDAFDARCLEQALNSRGAPGVTDLVLNPDAHAGYGAPVGCVLVSPTHVYPGPVGVDIKCSMSLVQLDLPADAVVDNYIDDMSLGANFATVNHMLINALVIEAFQEIIPGTQGSLVYFISHNIARREIVANQECSRCILTAPHFDVGKNPSSRYPMPVKRAQPNQQP